MVSVEEIVGLDEALGVQLKLALASPLWKGLPYGMEMNPRQWDLEVLELRPHHRLSLKLTVPWRASRSRHLPWNSS